MTIGTNIKTLRRERDITQEQLAEFLNVSAQAVSQWETDKTAPDISLLPILANVFGVTTDCILGVDITKENEKIKTIVEDSKKSYAQSKFEEAIAVLEKWRKEFPRSYEIMYWLAENLSCLGRYSEAVELCKKILSECTDDEIRCQTTQTLIYAYRNSGSRQRAVEIAKTCPPTWSSKEDMLMFLLEKTDADFKPNLQEYMLFCLGRLEMGLRMLGNDEASYSADDRLKLLKQCVSVCETVFCDGDTAYHSYSLAGTFDDMSVIYANRKDTENTLLCLEKEAEHAARFLGYDFNSHYTSPAFRGKEVIDWMPDPDGKNLADDLLEGLNCPVYDFVRDTERFKAVIGRLKELSEK